MPASEALALSGADWAATLGDLIVPMVGHLAVAVNAQSGVLRGAERSLKLAVGLMTKTLLQNLTKLQCQPGFAKLWDRILQVRTAPPAPVGVPGFLVKMGFWWHGAADVCLLWDPMATAACAWPLGATLAGAMHVVLGTSIDTPFCMPVTTCHLLSAPLSQLCRS